MFTLYIVLLILGVVIFTHRQYKWNQHVQKYKEFYNTPSPFNFPLVGSTYILLGKNILRSLKYVRRVFGKQSIVYITHRTYITSDPEEIKVILHQALEKSKEYDHLQEILGSTLLLCKSHIWKKNRKLLSRSFKQNILDMFVPTFYEKSQILMDVLKNGDYHDIYYCFEKYTLDIFCEATLGIKSSILKAKKSEFVEGVTGAQQLMFNRIGNIIKMNNFLFQFHPDKKKILKYSDDITNFIKDIIKKKTSDSQDDQELIYYQKGLPVLDLLLEVKEKENFSEEYICKEMNLFAGAATDTTAYSLAYVFCLLALNQDVQKKVYDEIIEVVGKDAALDVDHLNLLKYTEMALNESMRLLPAVPIIARQATFDIDLGTKVIPKDTGIIINIIGLHRDPEIYPNPTVYDPDRFLPENVKSRHPYSFIPFSAGPRNCIGWKYAQMVLKTTIANVVRNFRIETKYKSLKELKFVSSVVMMTTEPLDLLFVPRSEN